MPRSAGEPGAAGLRVLHVLEAIEGGTSRYLLDVVHHTHDVDHHVALPDVRRGGNTDPRLHPTLRADGAILHSVPMTRFPTSGSNLRALVQLRRLIRDLRPDVLHVHSSVGGALGRVAALGTPVPVVYTPQGIAAGRGPRTIERLLAHTTDRLIAASPSEAELVRSLRLVPDLRLTMVRNGIDLEAAVVPSGLREELGLAPDVILVGTIARLVPQKAPEVFVAACAAVAVRRPEAHFVLVGSGELQPLLDAEVQRQQLKDRFHQIPSDPSAARLLSDLDVFVLSSRFEGAPYAPMEAMRAGAPVVLTDVVGSRETVEHDVSGILVPPEDPERLAAAVVSLIEDPCHRARLIAGAHQRLRELFDVRTMGRHHQTVYRDLTT